MQRVQERSLNSKTQFLPNSAVQGYGQSDVKVKESQPEKKILDDCSAQNDLNLKDYEQ